MDKNSKTRIIGLLLPQHGTKFNKKVGVRITSYLLIECDFSLFCFRQIILMSYVYSLIIQQQLYQFRCIGILLQLIIL